MTEPLREQVSALLDGELTDSEMGLLVRRLERDAELRAAFGRYALLGEALRAPGDRLASPQFAGRLAASLSDGAPRLEPAQAEAAVPRTRFGRASLAVAAAGVGAVAIALVTFQQGASPDLALAELQPTVIDARRIVPAGITRPGRADVVVAGADSLTPYLIAHSQFVAPVARRIVLTNVIADDPGIARDESMPAAADSAVRGPRTAP